MSITTDAVTTCPAWCRTDHDFELQASALGAGDLLDMPLDEPLHQQEVGHIAVVGRDGGLVPVRVFIEQGRGQGQPAQIAVLCFEETAGSDDVYSAQQARALAALLGARGRRRATAAAERVVLVHHLRLVQEVLGHSSPAVTAGYAAHSPTAAVLAVEALCQTSRSTVLA